MWSAEFGGSIFEIARRIHTKSELLTLHAKSGKNEVSAHFSGGEDACGASNGQSEIFTADELDHSESKRWGSLCERLCYKL